MVIRTRRAAVAGLFYPAQPAILLTTVQHLFEEATAVAAPRVAVIVPHAGYAYSGRTAARVFTRTAVPRCCIVVAPNHTGSGHARHGGSVYAVGTLETPLGEVPVEETVAAGLLARCPVLEDDPDAHRTEHAVEVLLPFLFARRPDVAVVPIVLGWSDWPHTRALGEALAETVRATPEPVLLVASSDMNHYESASEGRRKDDMALERIVAMDAEGLLDVTRKQRITMCGRVAASAVLHAAKLLGASRAELVDYSHSGMATGDDSSVVGYAGVVIT